MADPDPTRPPPATEARKPGSPLPWLLALLILLAFGWFVYNQRAGVATAPEAPPPAIEIGDGDEAAAERERAADDARRAADQADGRGRTRAPARSTPAPDRDASPLARVEPEYPLQAYRDREEGTVLVGVHVDEAGKAAAVHVVKRSGSRELDEAAVAAVRQWTFEPAIRGGRAVASDVEVPVTFRIGR